MLRIFLEHVVYCGRITLMLGLSFEYLVNGHANL